MEGVDSSALDTTGVTLTRIWRCRILQEDLWWNTQFCLIAHECFVTVEREEQIQGLESKSNQGPS